MHIASGISWGSTSQVPLQTVVTHMGRQVFGEHAECSEARKKSAPEAVFHSAAMCITATLVIKLFLLLKLFRCTMF